MADLGATRWLITGANGTIGSGLWEHLRGRVAGLVLADVEAPTDLREDEVGLACDLGDPASIDTVAGICADVDGVIHLAGIPSEAPYDELLRVNALGTYHVLEGMRRGGARRLVYASSNHVTGLHPTAEELDDTSTVRPDGLYGASKAAAEAVARMYADKFGLSVIILRIGSFSEHPSSDREGATWLSHGDAWRAFEAAMTTDADFALCYGVSANTNRVWSLEPGRAIGFEPLDDAADHLGEQASPEPEEPQAGEQFASQDFTLRHTP
ncbi:NAD-dependent epimerase/dehydratase family protein [Microlunatus sp. Y2014]|uniref:NAD-dependent epimerase/dehydratase family protein n=1 Tax=Microlunatus sp. Y2014 TaxID=3418488 RepID=UPI003DA770B2